MNCSDYFGLDKSGCVFGTEVTDNGTGFGEHMGRPSGTAHTSCGIDTIKKSRGEFSERDNKKADAARRLQHVSGHPSDSTLVYSLITNGIKNCLVTQRDVGMAKEILGTSKHAIAGKTTRTRPDAVDEITQAAELPPTIMEYYKNVELSIDVLHVNRIPFLATLSKNIHYSTMDALDNMKISTIEHVIDTVLRAYAVRGFHVRAIHVDIQFKAILDRENLPVLTNVVSRGEHVPEIERYIRVVKERA